MPRFCDTALSAQKPKLHSRQDLATQPVSPVTSQVPGQWPLGKICAGLQKLPLSTCQDRRNVCSFKLCKRASSTPMFVNDVADSETRTGRCDRGGMQPSQEVGSLPIDQLDFVLERLCDEAPYTWCRRRRKVQKQRSIGLLEPCSNNHSVGHWPITCQEIIIQFRLLIVSE